MSMLFCRLHPLSPAAQIMEEVVSPCMGTPLTFCEAEQSRPQTFSLHRPAAVLREVEVHLEEVSRRGARYHPAEQTFEH